MGCHISISISNLLKSEFNERCRQKKNYSLRAFSRDLKISPSFLSEILNGKKMISADKALAISRKLGWSWRDTQVFLQTSQLSSAKNKLTKKFIQREIEDTISHSNFKNLKITKFNLISDWYYLAILELLELKNFKDDPQWVARRLKINVSTASQALETLKANGLIVISPSGKYIKNKNNSVSDTPSSEIRKFHRQQLFNAVSALEGQSFQNRHFSGITMAINPEKIPEAIELIKEFRTRMSTILENGVREKVYHLSIQLFQLDSGDFCD